MKQNNDRCKHFDYIFYENTKHNKTFLKGYCMGTKDREICTCQGNKLCCDFYPEIKLEAYREKIINSDEYQIAKAISYLTKHGFKVEKIYNE